MFGKVLGAMIGFFLTRSIIGAVVGAVAGHFFLDKAGARRANQSGENSQGFRFRGVNFGSSSMFQRQDLFFQSFFRLLGHLANADGKVSKEEENYINTLLNNMRLYGPMRNMALEFFKNGCTGNHAYLDLAKEFLQSSANQPQLRNQLLYQLVGLACSDKVVTKEERTFLEEVARVFQISQSELEHHLSSFGVKDDKAYHVLGVHPSASDIEVKSAYKKAVKEFHPDILKSKGLPPSMLEFAQKRFYDIQEAWDKIKKSRNLTE